MSRPVVTTETEIKLWDVKFSMLPWSTRPWNRCKALFSDYPYKGRCDLKRGHRCAHAAERGMDIVRWEAL